MAQSGRFSSQDEQGRNILHVAVMRNHKGIVEYLLSQHTRNLFLQTDKQGANALFIACHQGNPATVAGIITKFAGDISKPAADGCVSFLPQSRKESLCCVFIDASRTGRLRCLWRVSTVISRL